MEKHVKLTANKTAKIIVEKRKNLFRVHLQFGTDSEILYLGSNREAKRKSQEFIDKLPRQYKNIRIEYNGVIRTFNRNVSIPEKFLTKFADDRLFDSFFTNNRYTPNELVTVDTDTLSLEQDLQLEFIRAGFTLSEATEKAQRLTKKLNL